MRWRGRLTLGSCGEKVVEYENKQSTDQPASKSFCISKRVCLFNIT